PLSDAIPTFNRQIPGVQHNLEWIDPGALYCSFDARASRRRGPCSDASKDEGGSDGEQTDLTHQGLVFVGVHNLACCAHLPLHFANHKRWHITDISLTMVVYY